MTETLTLEKLSPADITALLAGGRARGQYDAPVNGFADSGDTYTVITENPLFAGKESNAVLSSVKAVIKRRIANGDDTPRLSAVARKMGDGDKKVVLLINLDALDAANAAKDSK